MSRSESYVTALYDTTASCLPHRAAAPTSAIALHTITHLTRALAPQPRGLSLEDQCTLADRQPRCSSGTIEPVMKELLQQIDPDYYRFVRLLIAHAELDQLRQWRTDVERRSKIPLGMSRARDKSRNLVAHPISSKRHATSPRLPAPDDPLQRHTGDMITNERKGPSIARTLKAPTQLN